MADRAYLIDSSGNSKLVFAEKLTEADCKNEYHCCGKNCNCRLVLCISSKNNRENYFAALPAHPHINGCTYNESAKATVIKHFNINGGTAIDALFQGFNKPVLSSNGPKGPTNPKGRGGLVNPKPDDNEDGPILRESKDPRNAKELYNLLTSFEHTHVYSNFPVTDLLFDSSNKERLENGKLPEDHAVLVVCHRCAKNILPASITIPKNNFILRYYAHSISGNEKPILFIFPVNAITMSYLFDHNKLKQIVVFGKWHHNTVNPNIYYCTTELSIKSFYLFNPSK